ncbi:MAG: bifunctional aspartokinase / homoserine dehydrogenase 1 [Gemmatimonadaceae bacterium]|nr:bifunctional aspartokinase / homoserine dehydrogenase 1 [Gemmatimonadaceae bacterium]
MTSGVSVLDADAPEHVPRPSVSGTGEPARYRRVQLLDRFELESGAVLRDIEQVYFLDGALNEARDNLVVVFHALTGSADAVGDWWRDVAGPDLAIDTNRYAVLCTNLLGSCYGTTGPSDPARRPFPEVTTRDMARLVGELVQSLHVPSVALAIGGSLGGMVAMEFAATYPALTRNVVVLAAPAQHPASAIAWSHIQRRAIAAAGDEGLEIARMIAMMTYRTAGELAARFGREERVGGGFAVARYLSRQGEKLRARFDSHTYLMLLDAMDSHDVGRGRGGVAHALSPVKGKIIGVGIPGDLLYDPTLDVRSWTEVAGAEYREIESQKGHDGFLLEGAQVSALLRELLGGLTATEDYRPGAVGGAAGGRGLLKTSNGARPYAVEPTRSARADVVILGYGRIGRELARQLDGATGRIGVRVAAVIDRSGFVLDPNGLSGLRLESLADSKESGISLADAPSGVRATASEALASIRQLGLSRPILVDLTASDTTPELEEAITAGMDLVLANKRPLADLRDATRGLARHAAAHGRRVLHEATVGAGLPLLDTISKLQESGDEVLAIEGCPSGTLGYLFGEIGRGTPFSTALRAAMVLGYTEPDPREDLSGMDVARKALILAQLLGYEGTLDNVEVVSLVPEGLRAVPAAEFLSRLDELDSAWRDRVSKAHASGSVLRYRATVTADSVRVGLVAVDVSSSFATLTGTDNQFAITTKRYRSNPIVITGPGAGVAVTAAGVLNDVLKLARWR